MPTPPLHPSAQLLSQLQKRKLVQDVSEGLEKMPAECGKGLYLGIDPTADSLHVGNLASIMLLFHAQQEGFSPVVLMGEATARIGDPSGKNTERTLMDEALIEEHATRIKAQLGRFLDPKGKTGTTFLSNKEWFGETKLLPFLRDIGKHFSINYMLNKETIRSRLSSGISFTEFSYQLIQAYDFYHLCLKYGVYLQVGGSDQWGNITAGIELIRRKLSKEAHGLTTPLITRSDGTKFGKSETDNIWLSAERTSPYAFYQFWLNQEDNDCLKLGRTFTLFDEDKLLGLQEEQKSNPSARLFQREIAKEVSTRVHGEASCKLAIEASSLLFGGHSPLEASRMALASLATEIPSARIPRNATSPSSSLYELLVDAAPGLICASRSELRRLIASRSLKVNEHTIKEETSPKDLKPSHGRYFLVKRGKKNFFMLELMD